MRSDYLLYITAIVFFILAAVGYLAMEPQINMVITAVLVILGIISAGAGYLVRPEEMTLAPPPPPPSAPKSAPELSAPPSTFPPKITATPHIEITEVKGIGPKRAEQLRALGIYTAQDLAKTRATTLAAKTDLSPKITSKWVTEAKRLIEEVS